MTALMKAEDVHSPAASTTGPAGRGPGSLARRVPLWSLVWLARVAGSLTLVSVISPTARGALVPLAILPFRPVTSVAVSAAMAVSGLALVVLAAGLRRRKGRAWQASVIACLLVVSPSLVGRHPVVPMVAAVLLLGCLLLTRRTFTALPDPMGRRAALTVLTQLVCAGFLVVTAMVSVRPRLLLGQPSFGDRLAQAGLSLVGVSGPVHFRAEWLDDVTAATGLTFGIAALAMAGYFFVRSAEPRPGTGAADHARLQELLAAQGHHDSLSYFVLRRDKSITFSPSGKAVIAYRVLAGTALASGDPVGDVEAWPGAIAEFLATCRRFGWAPAVLGCSERGARVWRREGDLDALELGDEAVIDATTFSLEGRAMRTVRQAVARVHRAGYSTSVRRARDVPAEELAMVGDLVGKWRGGPDERGFSMALSRLADPVEDPEAVLVVASVDGVPRALLQFVPWGPDGLSLDRMIRDPEVVDNGLNEMLVADLLRACRGLGVDRVSLNFAVFRSALERGERIGAGPVARLWARVLHVASRWWQIDSLYRFNLRFGPTWHPRFLVFDDVRDLPRIAVAAFEAEGYGGRPPLLLRLLRRHA